MIEKIKKQFLRLEVPFTILKSRGYKYYGAYYSKALNGDLARRLLIRRTQKRIEVESWENRTAFIIDLLRKNISNPISFHAIKTEKIFLAKTEMHMIFTYG